VNLGVGREHVGPARLPAAFRFPVPGTHDVLQVLLRFVGGASAGAEQQRVCDVQHPRHLVTQVQVAGRVTLGIDHHKHHLAHATGDHRHLAECVAQPAVHQCPIQQALHAQVVGQAAVDQVDVGALAGVQVLVDLCAVQALAVVARFARWTASGAHHPLPGLGRTLVGEVLDRQGAKHDRHGRRCGDGKRQRHLPEVRAQQRELVPGELETGASRQIGRGNDQLRMARTRLDVGIGHAAVQAIELALQQIAASEPGRSQVVQIARPRQQGDQVLLEVISQELRLEIRQTLAPERRVVRRHDGAARHATDQVGRIQQRQVLAVPVEMHAVQCPQHAVAKGRRARPTTRDGDCHHQAGIARAIDVRLVHLPRRHRRVDPGAQR